MTQADPDFGYWKKGVLSKRQLEAFCDAGWLTGPDGLRCLCGESAIDLRIDGRVFKLKHGSVKPFGPGYLKNLKDNRLIEEDELIPEPDGSTVLKKTETYLLPISEKLEKRSSLWRFGCHGQATAKSSIGRLDVLARLIVDGASVYENFTPECLRGSTGELFVEVTPITFPIRVRKGDKLVQLRLFKNSPRESELTGKRVSRRVLASDNQSLSVSLVPTSIVKGGDNKYVAFEANGADSNEPIDLAASKSEGAHPTRYWKPAELHDPDSAKGNKPDSAKENKYFKIEPNSFYILRSAELLSVPDDIAVYCRASDEAVGEMRIHYAGFVHPRFGLDRTDGGCGTPLIFEVRGHNVSVLLADRERMATLVLYKMSEPYQGTENSEYGNQTLKLSKHFKDWPNDETGGPS